MTIRTRLSPVIMLQSSFICTKSVKPAKRVYRNPVIYARELIDEMVRDNLTRKQLAARHGVSSDRITQWLCLLKLPEERLKEMETLGDYWDSQVVTERKLREFRRSAISKTRREYN